MAAVAAGAVTDVRHAFEKNSRRFPLPTDYKSGTRRPVARQNKRRLSRAYHCTIDTLPMALSRMRSLLKGPAGYGTPGRTTGPAGHRCWHSGDESEGSSVRIGEEKRGCQG